MFSLQLYIPLAHT